MRLHSGAPFWLLRDGLQEMGSEPAAGLPPSCDVVVIGAGITGALVADSLSAQGMNVVVLDRRAPASGSTAASTALLSYEIDVSLRDLIEMIGEEGAVRAYQLSEQSVRDLVGMGAVSCPSLCLATKRRHRKDLEQEVAIRRQHGLDAEFWPPERVEQSCGFPSHGAIRTSTAGVIDPVRFTRSLLERAAGRGALLLARTPARDVQPVGPGLSVKTDRGSIRAGWVVYAMGYEMPPALRKGMVALHSTYALVTEPLGDLGPWKGECIVWETARPYCYMRATDDDRVMIGGADMPFKNPTWRDRLLPDRTRRLEKQLVKWLPSLTTQTAFSWAGTFGETRDGLPYIGPMAGCPQALYALGYGANGITFGMIAAQLIADYCLGRSRADMELFRLDR